MTIYTGQVYWHGDLRAYATVYYRDDLPEGHSVATVVIMRTLPNTYAGITCRRSTWKNGVPKGWVLFYEPGIP